jgi:hypothetical protein
MISIKTLLPENHDQFDEMDEVERFDTQRDMPQNELSGVMGRGTATWDTPKAFSTPGAPVRTNEQAPPQKKDNKLSAEEKKKLLELVGKFSEYRRALKVADEFKSVAENIEYIAELTEKYGINETSDWFDGVGLDRDIKEIKRSAQELMKIAGKIHPQVKLAESIYEEIGLKLSKYYDIS